MKLTLKECTLCHAETELELSHVIPKFVLLYLKNTSAGSIRSMENPNVTVQDGEKHYMLCGKCEDLFSTYEKQFADKLFHPYLKDRQKRFEYDTWLRFFLTSVSWRHLYLDLIDFVENHVVGLDALECLIDSEKIMREYLLGNRTDIGSIEHHVFSLRILKQSKRNIRIFAPIQVSIVVFAAIQRQIKTCFLFTNMMRICSLSSFINFAFTSSSSLSRSTWVSVMRMSFKPDEVSPEEAHKIGCELAMKFTGGQHQFVVATHTDKQDAYSQRPHPVRVGGMRSPSPDYNTLGAAC